jgi:hypothetical protein
MPQREVAPESSGICKDLKVLTAGVVTSATLLHVAPQHRLANQPHLSHKVWDKDHLGHFLNLAESTG